MPVQPGEQVRVTITNQGAPGYLVDITAAGQTAFNTSPDTNASPCVAGAVEQSDFPTYDHLTQTTPVAFHASRVWWAQEGQPTATETKLLSTPPAHAKLYRYNLVNTGGTVIAAASTPTDSNKNFTVTDK
jgi:hypothetical protein